MNLRNRISFAIYALFVALIFAYGGFVLYRADRLYEYVKSSQRGWSGQVHRVDSLLGFAPIPNSQGEHIFPIGPPIPMRYNSRGFRAPVGAATNPELKRPLILALGCSFTYGDGCYAEETYPHLVGELLGGSSLNAGVPSYGLAQMLLLAKRLIPQYQPDYVVVQYSPWLVDRAMSPFAPAYFGRLTSPYFYETDGILAVQQPVFSTQVLDLRIDAFRRSERGTGDFLKFFIKVGLPLQLHDHRNLLWYNLKRVAGEIPDATDNRTQVVRKVYEEIAADCREYGADMLIMVLGVKLEERAVYAEELAIIEGIPNSQMVDAEAALWARIPDGDWATYQREYHHWRGDPPQLIDDHPNAQAHRLIAGALVAAIAGNDEE